MTRALVLVFTLLAALPPSTTLADDGPPPAPKAPPNAVRVLEVFWPSHPESVAMLADILQGSRLGPTDGWFRKAVAKTRFDARGMIARFDKDGDGRVDADEFVGSARDFARLDRNHDGAITPADFDFSANALAPSPGMTLFMRADRDGDGKVTKAELDAFFNRADSDARGFLSLDDAKAIFAPPSPPAPANAKIMKNRPAPAAPPLTKWTLLKGLYRQEIGSLQPGPDLNAVAPDFTLKTVDGQQEITLSKLVGPKPVVLIFGNFTCGPFCSQSGNVQKLYERYKDRATFVMVYVREAHPKDGWVMSSNEAIGVSLRQPLTYEERVGVAQQCAKKLKFGMPMLVDTIDDTVGARYSGMPSRLYLIDSQGKVAFKNGRGPFGFKTAELENALIWMLNEPESSVAAKTQ
jgi:Iodothyronine deiodinase/EF hand